MISIVTAYYNRRALFTRTLESLGLFESPEFEFVAVDDGSRDDERIEDLQEKFPFLRVIRLEPADKWYCNPCIPFNVAIREARGDLLVLQNPECLHFGPVLDHAGKHLQNGSYLSYGCYALGWDDTCRLEGEARSVHQQLAALTLSRLAPKEMAAEGWYNHSVIRPCGYHFCCAITREDMTAIGGFDERFATGASYDDDDLLCRIRLAGLKVRFIDEPHVFHQNHYPQGIVGIPGPRERRNQRLLEWTTHQAGSPKVNPWNWGKAGGSEVRAVNAALDAILLGNATLDAALDGDLQWQEHLKLRASQKLVTPEMIVVLREGLKTPLELAAHLRQSWLTCWLWNGRTEQDHSKILQRIKRAGELESKQKPDKAGEKYIEAIERLGRLLADISNRHRWWPFIPRRIISAVASQAAALGEWWRFLRQKNQDHSGAP